jgi:hypothetical protein
MSILYSSLISNKERNKIAESSNGKMYRMQIKNVLPQIYDSNINDRLECDGNFITWFRTKGIIFLAISPKRIGEERPRTFIEILINKLVKISGKDFIQDITAGNKIPEEDLVKLIDKQIEDFNTGLEDKALLVENIDKDVVEIKKDLKVAIKKVVENQNDLEEILVTSNKLKKDAKTYKNAAKELEEETRFCCKPIVIKITISFSILVVIALIYIIISLVRCGNLNIACSS